MYVTSADVDAPRLREDIHVSTTDSKSYSNAIQDVALPVCFVSDAAVCDSLSLPPLPVHVHKTLTMLSSSDALGQCDTLVKNVDEYSQATAVHTPLTSTTIAPLVLESVPSRADEVVASQIERSIENTEEWPMVVQQITEHAANDDEIAQDLLNCIFSDHHDRGVRSKGHILQMYEHVTNRRNAFIQNRARQLSEEPNSHYSEKDWYEWLSKKCFVKEDMDAAVKAWKKTSRRRNSKSGKKLRRGDGKALKQVNRMRAIF